jgi:tol-pal system protein YbgF
VSRLTVSEPPIVTQDPAVPVSAAVPVTAPAVVAQPPPSTLGLSPERMYNTANSDYAAGSYERAIQGFQEFLKVFPTSPRAASAQQYMGDAEYQQSRWEPAIAAYNLVIQTYPKSDVVPWAYYKRGMAQSRLQQNAAARASFEAVVKMFPDTEPAVLAAGGLQRLDSTASPAAPRKP